MQRARSFGLFLGLLFILASGVSVSADEHAQWFVLRDQQTGYCWPALLVAIDGGYVHGSAQRAGGPYDREAKALERREALNTLGTCNQE